MEEWKEYKLEETTDFVAGFAFKSKHFGIYKDKVVKIKDIQPPIVSLESTEGVDLSKYDKVKLNKYIVKQNDFLLAMTGATIGKIGKYMNDKPAYINQRVLKFIPKQEFDFDFIYYSLLSTNFQRYINNHIDSDSAQPNISANTIGKYTFKAPCRKTQHLIATILKTLDDKIELNRRINDNLEQQAQALFKLWFVDFEPFKDGEFVDSELAMIPKGWTIKTLDSLCDIVGGGTPSKAKAEYYCLNGIAWLTPKDLSISHLKYSYHGEMDITELGYSNSSAKIMPKGTVLFSSRAPIGYISIAANEVCTNQGFKSLVPKVAGTCFLYLFLKENTSLIESQASGSTFKEVSGSLMKAQTVIVPNNTQILDNFEENVNNIFELQKNIELEILSLQTIRDSLLPRLMSGELKINDLNC